MNKTLISKEAGQPRKPEEKRTTRGQKPPLTGTPVPGGAVQQPDQGQDPEGLLETRQRLEEEDWSGLRRPHRTPSPGPESSYQRRTQPQSARATLSVRIIPNC